MSNDANVQKRKEQIKKWLVYSGMVLLCLVSFYFIFKPSKEQVLAEQQMAGFNAELPDPRGAGIEADKITAYELEDMRVKQEQKMRTLEDFSALTADDEEEEVVEIPEELTVHDNDGQAGIFIPGSMEASAAKEMAANLGQNLGTSISITNQSAGDQLLSEVGRGAIQGVSQYISKKMREEKVHLKSGYTLMLYQNNQ